MADAPKVSRPLQITVGVVLLANLLDLTTSLVESPADHLWPIEPKPPWQLALQAALVLPLIALAWTRRARVAEAARALPIPRPALVVLGAWIAIAAAHVALRAERYPFSPVTMFSSGAPEPTDELMHAQGYAIVHPDGIEVISWLREGQPAFARHGFGWDYKAGWTMHMYAQTHSAAQAVVDEQLAEEGSPPAVRVDFEYRREDGTLRLPPGQRERP